MKQIWFLRTTLTATSALLLVAACVARLGIAADADEPPATSGELIQRVVAIAKSEKMADPDWVGRMLGVRILEEGKTTASKGSRTAFKLASFPSLYDAKPRSFQYSIIERKDPFQTVASLSFHVNSDALCVSKDTVELDAGPGRWLPSPMVSMDKGGGITRETSYYGLGYEFRRAGKNVRVSFEFRWKRCLQTVSIYEYVVPE